MNSSTNELFDKEKSHGKDSRVTFNLAHYPVFRLLKIQLKELHESLSCDEGYKKNFLTYQLLVSRTMRI